MQHRCASFSPQVLSEMGYIDLRDTCATYCSLVGSCVSLSPRNILRPVVFGARAPCVLAYFFVWRTTIRWYFGNALTFARAHTNTPPLLSSFVHRHPRPLGAGGGAFSTLVVLTSGNKRTSPPLKNCHRLEHFQ